MRRLIFTAAALMALLSPPPAAEAAYLDASDWYRQAVTPNVMAGAMLRPIPTATQVVGTDFFGSYTPATASSPVYVGRYGPGPDPDQFAVRNVDLTPNPVGELSGSFYCHSAYSRCLGAHTITYTLPFEIIGLAGDLKYRFGYNGFADALPFFEFPGDYWHPENSIGYPDHPSGFSYAGFWGDTFTATDKLTVIWPAGLNSADDFATFEIDNLLVLAAEGLAGPVPVPAPASLVLFGAGLAGLAAARRYGRGKA